MPGYREEPGVDPVSSVETFVALRLDIDSWRWAGVPVYVRTGKRLPQRITEVAIAFQRPPQLPLFPGSDPEPDALLLRVAPSEGLSIRFGAKAPGRSFHVRTASMDFAYGEGFPHGSADAYERVISDALLGDPTLFIRADEVGRSWRIVDPIIGYWAASPDPIPRCTRPERGGPARPTTSSPPTAGAGGTQEGDAALDACSTTAR